MSKTERILEGGIVMLFICFWISVGLAVGLRTYRADDKDLFEMLKTFATGFGSALLLRMNSRSQAKTEVTGNDTTVTVNQPGKADPLSITE